jgi:hypothetical protein
MHLPKNGYTYHTVYHTNAFIDPCTGTHMNAIQATWKHVKVALYLHDQRTHYVYCLTEYCSVLSTRHMQSINPPSSPTLSEVLSSHSSPCVKHNLLLSYHSNQVYPATSHSDQTGFLVPTTCTFTCTENIPSIVNLQCSGPEDEGVPVFLFCVWKIFHQVHLCIS